MEMNERMSKRWWLLGVGILILVGLLAACGSKYNSSSNGLLVVGSQGSGLLETFSFSLNSGKVSAISNSPSDTQNQTCVLNGVPSSIVVGGSYAYAIINANPSCSGSSTGIEAFKLNSDGTIAATGSLVSFNTGASSSPVVPDTLSIDSAQKFLFVADRATTDSGGLPVPGGVSVFSIGSGGSVAEVAGSPFYPPSNNAQFNIDIVSVAASPTVFPAIGINGVQNAVCSAPGNNAPTAEYLYAVDQLGNQVYEFQVDTSTGALSAPTGQTLVPAFATDQKPAGVAVDPCDRFVYVSNYLANRISAYTICSTVIQGSCPAADGTLLAVSGSPFSLSGNANGPGPLVVDPYGNYVYVVGTKSNTVSAFKLSPISGSLTALTPAVVATGLQPTSITIRGDDNWMFVTNFNAASVSQYAITPASGSLTVQSPITTDNYPTGVAVK
jgi:6-phosphogluconolactonase